MARSLTDAYVRDMSLAVAPPKRHPSQTAARRPTVPRLENGARLVLDVLALLRGGGAKVLASLSKQLER